ncbi:CRISPR-associated helicase Cas3' [Streptomyces sp. NPDC002067]
MVADPLTNGVRRTLVDLRAKSRPKEDPERLTTHLRLVYEAVGQIEARIGNAGVIATQPPFWPAVRCAALLHDAGKIAEGFQRQVEPGGTVWGERHEVLSLAYVDLLAPVARWSDTERMLIGTLVASHHRPLHTTSSLGGGRPALARLYNARTRWEEAFGDTPGPDGTVAQVPRYLHQQFLAWLSGFLAVDPPPARREDPPLARRAAVLLDEVLGAWRQPVKAHPGLLAVLAQGALTLADHAGSAHERLQTHMPLLPDFLERLPYRPHPHQQEAAAALGHLVLVAPTGSGKTEAGLAWAARQAATMPGQPRVVWTLPYRASLNAVRRRFERGLVPAPGERKADIGLLHGAVARMLLQEAVEEDCGARAESGRVPHSRGTGSGQGAVGKQDAVRARARANAMRLFTQRVRVATPYQLLSGALVGPSHSSVLLEQANCLFVLDELHAYEPEVLGRVCASARLWERLGSRFAVLSATLAPQLLTLVDESVEQQVTLQKAPPGTAPVRHRLVLDERPLTDPESIGRLTAWLREGHSVLVVANTVDTAQKVFTELADEARTARPDDPHAALLLHSRFKNRDRDALERNLLRRHPERSPGEDAHRGGLVVATQTVEVSLTLDFDRGAVENAPIEAVAQRAGRVNRRGRHPESTVEFRVHRTDGHRPYEERAVAAAWYALKTLVSDGVHTLGEEDIDRLLALAYDTEWGHEWLERARTARDAFAEEFLNFTDPFHDRSEHAASLSERFDTVEVLLHDDREEYVRLVRGSRGDPLLAAGLLIPLKYGQLKKYRAQLDKRLGVHLIDADYDHVLGLHQPPEKTETIL